MGESQGRMFEPTFNRAAKVEASDCRLTSDAGALVLREFVSFRQGCKNLFRRSGRMHRLELRAMSRCTDAWARIDFERQFGRGEPEF